MNGMAEQQDVPLTRLASASSPNVQTSTTLPSEVVACLKNARFVSGGCRLRQNPD